MFLALLIITLCSNNAINALIDGTYNECDPNEKQCEIWLFVREELTMIKDRDLVYAEKGLLYKDNPDGTRTELSADDVLSLDGYNRMVIAINETIPGPPIIVYKGQTVVVHFHNQLLSDSVTIHWHGLHQKTTPWMDGVGYITQCPIGAGQKFTYEFKAEPSGTFWYHSHVGGQRSNGVFGAFIIKERDIKSRPTDMIMTVGDWHHESSEEVYWKMIYGNYVRNKKYNTTESVDGGKFSNVPWVSGLIEGRSSFTDQITGVKIDAPLTWYELIPRRTYRFRVIGVGALYPLRISVDNHLITVVASDGYDIVAEKCESFIINPGERYDFELTANQTVGNYWIRADSIEVNVKNHNVKAVLHYRGASLSNEPTSNRQICTLRNLCVVVNCAFSLYPMGDYIKCLHFSDLKNADASDTVPVWGKDSKEYFLNFAFPGTTINPGSVNGRKFVLPGVNSLDDDAALQEYACKDAECGKEKTCDCHYELEIPYDQTIQMIWTNMGNGTGWGHPMHLHGHSFYVLKMAYAGQDKRTGKMNVMKNGYPQVDDIDCGGDFCNAADWKDKSWKNGNISGLNLKNPPRKDTLIIPPGGYAVLRIRSDNPGKWFMHCHIEVHSLNGMAMVLKEAMDKKPKTPEDFPQCKNFYNNVLYNPKKATPTTSKDDKRMASHTIIVLLLSAIIFFA